ncbi:MAG TPA: GntR family transcriptional regulator [Anaerolineales bacterium]|nr:GntR family transcriptional regulator [Anaerolineales bacterium]
MTGHGLDPAIELERLQKKSLKDEVFEYLHRRIVAGKYSPGEWLRQEELSTLLGVSQTPVREALDRLVSVGLAERVPYRGVRVPELNQDEILDAYVLRTILESAAVRIAAENISDDQIKALFEIVAQTRPLVSLDDMSRHRQLNKAFHISIVQASGNSLLSKLYEMTSNLFPDWMLYEYMFRHPELLQVSLDREYQEHRAIVDAIAAHEPEQAAVATLQHIKHLGTQLVDFLGIPANRLQEKERLIGLNPDSSPEG